MYDDDINVLSTFLKSVKHAIEEMVGHEVVDVVPAFPPIRMFDFESAQEAFERAGLNWLRSKKADDSFLYETNAAYAGIGAGLPKDVFETAHCMHDAPVERVLFLYHLTPNSYPKPFNFVSRSLRFPMWLGFAGVNRIAAMLSDFQESPHHT